MEGTGVKFTQPDIGPWVEKAKAVHTAFAKERGAEYSAIMEKIYAAQNKKTFWPSFMRARFLFDVKSEVLCGIL